jgi:hypothetical protein
MDYIGHNIRENGIYVEVSDSWSGIFPSLIFVMAFFQVVKVAMAQI